MVLISLLQMTHPSKQSLLDLWGTIQESIDGQQHSRALGRWERIGHSNIANMLAQRPTIFVFTSGAQGANGDKIRVAQDCCEHFEAKSFAPCVIMGLNLAENDGLKHLLSPWVTKSNRAHLSWFLCFMPKLYQYIDSFEDNDAFFICEDSARLLECVTVEHLKHAGSDKWLAYRWKVKGTCKKPIVDNDFIITKETVSSHNAVGSKLFCLKKSTIYKLWRLLLQTDVNLYFDWHTNTMVVNQAIERVPASFGYSARHHSYQTGDKILDDEYPQTLMTPKALNRLLGVREQPEALNRRYQ